MSKQAAAPNRVASTILDFSTLHDIAISITVEIDRSTLSVRELLGIKPEHVVATGKSAGSAVDVCINGRQVARGEIVALGGKAGVRITEIVKRGTNASGARL